MPSKSTRNRSTATDDVAVMAQDPAHVGGTAPASAPVAGTPALSPSVPDTAATRGVWAALVAQPGSTAASLADAAGISRPTAAKTLALLEKAGLVTRAEGGREGSKRLPDQWQPVVRNEAAGASDGEPADAPEPAAAEVPEMEAEEVGSPEQAEPEPSNSAEDTDATPVARPVAEAEEAGTTEPDERQPARTRKPRSGARTGKPATAPKADAGTSRLGSGQLREMVLQFLRDHPGEDFSSSAMGKTLARSSGAIYTYAGHLGMRPNRWSMRRSLRRRSCRLRARG